MYGRANLAPQTGIAVSALGLTVNVIWLVLAGVTLITIGALLLRFVRRVE